MIKFQTESILEAMNFDYQNEEEKKIKKMNYGEYNRNMDVLNIQPVIPLAGGKFITRTIIPIVFIPDFAEESGMHSSGLRLHATRRPSPEPRFGLCPTSFRHQI